MLETFYSTNHNLLIKENVSKQLEDYHIHAVSVFRLAYNIHTLYLLLEARDV